MSYEAVDCVDAGSDYCPCYLAETNNCLICSQLQGKFFCDCINWKGVCIYQEYIWNGEKMKEARENINAKILKLDIINDKVIFLKIKVTKTLARELNQPGSYIFLRDINHPDIFDAPMSVMYSYELDGTIDLLIQVRGIKTRALRSIDDSIIIRGPYWNGIMGLKNLKVVSNKNCLIVARGIAQAPSVLVAKKLRYSNNSVYVILDQGSSQTTIANEYFNKLGCSIIEANILNKKVFDENARLLIKKIIAENNISLIFSGGSDIIHKNILELCNSNQQNLLFSCTNNSNICCGEGVCGSCTTRLQNGKKIKACKSQVDPIDIIGGIS